MRLPRGDLVYARVVADPAAALAEALERRLTGYAVLTPQNAVLLDDDARGVLTFEGGVPTLAYHSGTDRGGAAALAALGSPGPVRAELFALDATALERAHEATDLRVAPGAPAEELAGDPDLAARTRDRAPPERLGDADAGEPADAVTAFLEDEERLAAIQEQAQAEARERAEAWGLTDELAGGDDR
jgi:hypothetical protein